MVMFWLIRLKSCCIIFMGGRGGGQEEFERQYIRNCIVFSSSAKGLFVLFVCVCVYYYLI